VDPQFCGVKRHCIFEKHHFLAEIQDFTRPDAAAPSRSGGILEFLTTRLPI
jgi:hypothetical protein